MMLRHRFAVQMSAIENISAGAQASTGVPGAAAALGWAGLRFAAILAAI
jgi:hypothetical protein